MLQRLLDMGLTPGTRIKVVKVAPFNGPVEVPVQGQNWRWGKTSPATFSSK